MLPQVLKTFKKVVEFMSVAKDGGRENGHF
jgi:hypothetical protein